jgi:hypothetical protein
VPAEGAGRSLRSHGADVPQTDLVGTKRQRLEGRLNRLTQLYGWGELEADDYRRQMTETRAMLAELPDPDKLIAFDRNRQIMVSMAENVEKATRPQLQELVQLLVESVQAKQRVTDPTSIEWTPPARPFFGEVRGSGAPGRARGANCQTRGEAGGPPVTTELRHFDQGLDSGTAHRPTAVNAMQARFRTVKPWAVAAGSYGSWVDDRTTSADAEALARPPG